MTNWVGMPVVPQGNPGTYNFLNAVQQNLRLAQAKLDSLQTSTGLGTVLALAPLAVSSSGSTFTVSANADITALGNMSGAGYVRRVGSGNYVLDATRGEFAPGRALPGDPAGVEPYGYIHEDIQTGNIWASSPGLSAPVIVNANWCTTSIVADGLGIRSTLPFTPAPGNLVLFLIAFGSGGFGPSTSGTPTLTQGFAQIATFSSAVMYYRYWQSSDGNFIHNLDTVFNNGFYAVEVEGAASTIGAAIDQQSLTYNFATGTQASPALVTSQANELAIAMSFTQSVAFTGVSAAASGFTRLVGTGHLSTQNVVDAGSVVTQGTPVSPLVNWAMDPSNNAQYLILLKGGVSGSAGWAKIGPVKTYGLTGLVVRQLASLTFTGNALVTTDTNGNITVNVGKAPANGVNFGIGAPSSLATDGALYFDTTNTSYQGYVQNSSAWSPFGGSALTTQSSGTTLTATTSSMNFTGAGVTASNTGSAVLITIPGFTGFGVQDAGSTITTAATTLNFTGSAVTSVTNASGLVTVNLTAGSGGGGGTITVENAGSVISTTATTLNFAGAGVTASIPALTPPSVRATSSGTFNATGVTAALPTGTIAGDLVYIAVESGWNVNAPSGWTVLDNVTGVPNSAFAGVFSKVMTSGDIATGSVTITFGGSYYGAYLMIAMVGAPTQRTFASATNAGTVTSASTVQAGDLGVFFGLSRGNSNTGISPGSLVQTTSTADAWGVMYEYTTVASGVQSEAFTWSGSGGYGAILYLAGTPSSSAVNITVPGATGSSSTGELFAPPLASYFPNTYDGSGASALTMTYNAAYGLNIAASSTVSGDYSRAKTKTVVNATWSIVARLRLNAPANAYLGGGIILLNTATNKLINFELISQGPTSPYQLQVNRENYPSGYVSTVSSFVAIPYAEWFKVTWDGTNYNFYVSREGQFWINVCTELGSAFLGSANQIGICLLQSAATSFSHMVTCPYWSDTA